VLGKMTNHEQESLSTLHLRRANECQALDQRDDLGWELSAVEVVHAAMYGGRYLWALIVGSWPADRQPVFNAEDEFPPVSIS
jgi:hypothetical protein